MDPNEQTNLSPQELANHLSPKYTPGPWRVGKYPHVVVSEHPIETSLKLKNDGGANDTKYYGGHLICESVLRYENAQLIAAAPTMYELLTKLISCKDEHHLAKIIDDSLKVIKQVSKEIN